MYADVISKPLYQIVSDLTQEPRLEVALPMAVKDWDTFQQRYGMDFAAFKQAWQQGQISDQHSYQVERDYWEWEATISDEERLQEMLESLP